MKTAIGFFLFSSLVSAHVDGCDPSAIGSSSSSFPWALIVILAAGLALIGLGLLSKQKKRRSWRKAYLATGIILLLWAGYRFYDDSLYKNTHIHANFKVIIDGKEIDFAKPDFMTESKTDHSKKVHLHDLNGDVVHVHYPGIAWRDFFQTIGMNLQHDCLDTRCGLHFYLNGQESSGLDTKKIRDLDRVLITNGGDLQQQLASVPDDACVYSGKCSERGLPKGIETKGGCVA